jgi:diguanylate cyclase (GGDEF)-like protein/PAS domain S-box-containing protein
MFPMTSPIHILTVEDNPADADLIRSYLAEIDDMSCDLEHVRRLEPALGRFDEHQFDLILLDAFLPDSAGYKTFERVEPATRGTPVIVLTGGDEPELERRALRHGAAGFLPKHALDSDLLARRIRHAIESQRIRAELRRTRRAIDRAQEGVVITDADGDQPIIYCNDAFEELTGYPESEILGRNCRFLQSDETDDETVREIHRAIDDERPVSVRLLNERRDGTTFWNELSITPIRNADGEVTEFVGFQRDVTDRLEAERQLERYRNVVENSTDFMILKNRDGEIVLANQRTLDSLEMRRDELVGTTIPELTDAETAAEIAAFDRRVLEEGETVSHQIEFDFADKTRIAEVNRIPYREEGDIVGTLAVARDVTENEQLRRELEARAFYDEITGLPNRALFRERLEELLRDDSRESPFAVAFIDIDNFKAINASFGHAVGDEFLTGIAERLDGALDDRHTVARLGGDEFSVLLDGLEAFDGFDEVGHRLADAFEAPIDIANVPVHVSLSIGLARLSPSLDTVRALDSQINWLTNTAKEAMQRAKQAPGFSWRTLTADLVRPNRDFAEIEIENQIRDGLQREEFVPYVQPLFRLDDGLPHGLEILARWFHPEHGRVSPGTFIPVAEKAGLLRAITERLVERTRRELERPADWPSPLCVNINISPAQLARADAVSHLASLLQDTAGEDVQFCLEITEAQLLERRGRVEALRNAGFPIIVDDFGTGYSSLTRIKELPMDELKLDMEFVQGAVDNDADRAILETVTELGHQLGVPVVGEGVETEAQLELLRRTGCTAAQGYFLEHPGPIPELMARGEGTRE